MGAFKNIKSEADRIQAKAHLYLSKTELKSRWTVLLYADEVIPVERLEMFQLQPTEQAWFFSSIYWINSCDIFL
jgi:hypothetical protein